MFGKFIFEHSPRVSDAAKLLIRILHVKACRNSLLVSPKCKAKLAVLFAWFQSCHKIRDGITFYRSKLYLQV
jgi:hypothetical protein